jgi:hypothetical protein
MLYASITIHFTDGTERTFRRVERLPTVGDSYRFSTGDGLHLEIPQRAVKCLDMVPYST